MYIVQIGPHNYPFFDNQYKAMRAFVETKCKGTQSDAAVLWQQDNDPDNEYFHALNYNFSQRTWQEVFSHPNSPSEMRMPYKVTFVAEDPETGKPYTFSEVYCGLDTFEVRQLCHSMHNADIMCISPVVIERFCIVETDIQNQLTSIMYTTDDALDAQQTLDKLNQAWASSTRYTFELVERD